MIKVRKGTRGSKRLCDTCDFAVIMKGSAESQEIITCEYVPLQMMKCFPIVECNKYSERGRPQLRDMRDVAWIIEPSKREGGVWGFTKASDFKRKNPDAEIIPPGISYDL